MNFRHGSLESIILNALWELEANGVYKIPLKMFLITFVNHKQQKSLYNR